MSQSLKVDALLSSIDVLESSGPHDGEITGVVCDSRHVRPGAAFVAIHGSREDGMRYVDDAVQRGVRVIVAETLVGGAKGVLRVRVANARRALARLSAAFYQQPSRSLQVVGITGTNGKTTTAYLVRNLLRAGDRTPGLISTVEYEIGARAIPAQRTTPEAPLLQSLLRQMVQAGCRSAVMEVSSHALDQERTSGIDFAVAVFTNLTRDHLDYHGTLEAYFAAKTRLFTAEAPDRPRAAVINIDGEWGRRLRAMDGLPAEVLTYGTGVAGAPPADVTAVDISLGAKGTAFRAITPWGEIPVRLRLLGRHNVSNALAALACGGLLGLDPQLMGRVLSQACDVRGRLERVDIGRAFDIFIDYAHTDDALQNVLETLREITARRLIVVFGCGGDRDRSKRPLMGAAACRLADFSILTSDNPRSEEPAAIIAEIEQGFGGAGCYRVVEDRKAAIGEAIGLAEKGDVVLIAGKGHETFQEFANKTVPFDDRQVVRDLA